MITGGRKATAHQGIVYLLHSLSCQAVNNAAFVRVLHDVGQGGRHFIRRLFYGKAEIFPVEARDQGDGVLEPQNSRNILPDLGGGGSRESADHRPHLQLFYKIRNFQIAGPEILSPLGNAVGLIHAHHGDLDLGSCPEKALRQKPLRSHIDDLIAALDQVPKRGLVLALSQGAV